MWVLRPYIWNSRYVYSDIDILCLDIVSYTRVLHSDIDILCLEHHPILVFYVDIDVRNPLFLCSFGH